MLAVPGEWPHPLRTHFRLWPLSGVGGPTPNPVWQRDERLENWIVAAKLRLWAGGVGWRLWICLDCKLHGQLPEDSSPWFPSLHSRLWGVGGGVLHWTLGDSGQSSAASKRIWRTWAPPSPVCFWLVLGKASAGPLVEESRWGWLRVQSPPTSPSCRLVMFHISKVLVNCEQWASDPENRL